MSMPGGTCWRYWVFAVSVNLPTDPNHRAGFGLVTPLFARLVLDILTPPVPLRCPVQLHFSRKTSLQCSISSRDATAEIYIRTEDRPEDSVMARLRWHVLVHHPPRSPSQNSWIHLLQMAFGSHAAYVLFEAFQIYEYT